MESEKKRRVLSCPIIEGHKHELEVAKTIGIKPLTLRKWRAQRRGPPFVKFAHRVYYRDDAVAAWLLSREIHPIAA